RPSKPAERLVKATDAGAADLPNFEAVCHTIECLLPKRTDSAFPLASGFSQICWTGSGKLVLRSHVTPESCETNSAGVDPFEAAAYRTRESRGSFANAVIT